MSKRKVFTFDESDLEWINPMLLEWEKENEGKKGGVLITELMKACRETQGPSKFGVFTQKVRSDYVRFKTGLGSRTVAFRTRMREVFGETREKLNHVASRIAAASKQVVDAIHSQVESRKR
jgi:hypothetical protein